MPSLGTGHYHFSHEEVSSFLIPKLNKFCDENKNTNIYLCLIDEETARIYGGK